MSVSIDMTQTLGDFVASLTSANEPSYYTALSDLFKFVIVPSTTTPIKYSICKFSTLEGLPVDLSTFTLDECNHAINYSLNGFQQDTLGNFTAILNSRLGKLYSHIDQFYSVFTQNVSVGPVSASMYAFVKNNYNWAGVDNNYIWVVDGALALAGFNASSPINGINTTLFNTPVEFNNIEMNSIAAQIASLNSKIAALTPVPVVTPPSTAILPPPFQNNIYLGNAITISGKVVDCRGNPLQNIGDGQKDTDAVSLHQLKMAMSKINSNPITTTSSVAYATAVDLSALATLVDKLTTELNNVSLNLFATTAGNVKPPTV